MNNKIRRSADGTQHGTEPLTLRRLLFIPDRQKDEKPVLSVLCGEISAFAQRHIRNGGQRQDEQCRH